MRVLVTGAAGFIGRHVVAALTAADHEVVGFDSAAPAALFEGKMRIGDVRDRRAVDDALTGVEVVCHLAAKVGLGVDVQDLPDYAAANDHGTAVLLAAMASAGVHRLVLASSMVVYGEGLGRCPEHGELTPGPRTATALAAHRWEPPCPKCGRPLAPALVGEHVPVDPRNAYAASKVAQEHFAAAWARATGSSVAALRYHNVYGPSMPRDTPYAGVAAIFVSALRSGSPPIVFEDGAQRRDFVHVRDVAAATALAAERHDTGLRAFNVGSGTPRTVGEMASALADVASGPAPVISGEYRLGDVRHITADSTRIAAEFGWSPQVEFRDGLAELAAGA